MRSLVGLLSALRSPCSALDVMAAGVLRERRNQRSYFSLLQEDLLKARPPLSSLT